MEMAILRHIDRWCWGLVLLLVLGAQLLWQPAPVRAATCIVTTNADSGAGSLREKIADTNCSTINFNGNYTIALSSELTISRNVTIDGAGHAITISGNNAARVFSVNAGITFNLSNVTVANGKVSSGNGGGIYNAGALNVTNSTFSDNSAGGSGGGIFNTGTLNVSNSTFSGNSAGYQGGGIYNLGTVTVINSTFSGGSASQGGGIFNGGTFNVTNSIVANNTGNNCFAFYAIGGSNNLANDGTCGAGFTNSSAILLSALGNYGGGTPTLALLPGSAAIDAGNDAICAAAPVNNLDQRGIARAQGTHCDIGAFESRRFALTISGGNHQTTHTNTAFANPLAVTIASASGDPVNGGRVTFTAPASGASTNPATNNATVTGGAVAQSVTANATGGSYPVTASANGAPSVTFTLTNTCSSAITVTNADDSGAGSLRQAIADVCGGGNITFNDNYTITLSSVLTIGWNMTIDGVDHTVAVSGNNAVRVFYVNAGVTFNLNNLTVANGNAGGDSGGGIYNKGALNVTNSVFSGNFAGGSSGDPSVIFGGGGIANYGAATVTNSTFSGNSTPYNSGGGGGIFNYPGAIVTVVNSTFSTNGLPLASGGGINNLGAATVTNSTFSGNSTGTGAGISNNGTLNVTNSTFSGNLASGAGGGISNYGGITTVKNSTFAGNSGGLGGGIYNDADATLTVMNSIIANSHLGGNCSGAVGGSHNLANDTSCGAGFTNSSAISLGALGDYGGNTQTFALLPGSAAIDAGDPTTCLLTDQRDLPRADLCCDIGAFELQYADSDTVILPVSSSALTTFGPLMAGVRRDAAFTDPGVMTMTRTAAGQLAHSIGALWAITPTVTGGFSLTLQLCYTEAELNGLDETALRFWRYHEGDWTMIDSSPTLTTVNGYHCATISGVTGLSNWTLATDDPTAVSLATFSAAWQGEAVLVTWETAQELENLGFNLYRSPSPTGPWTRLNPIMIPTQHPGAVFGGVYEWLDTTAPSGSASYYRLEDIDSDGVSTFHGPIRPADGEPAAVGLRGFRAAADPQALFMLMFVLAGVGGVTFQRWNRWRSLRS
ncbi:MAG TPA: choice-of-anchor Q domain-containing protein [Anaerolineae bacterium]|nr:choice-of-anchor Q domain-containing protein [Anaerolineae bacterium]